MHALEGDPAVWVIDPEFACKNLPWIPENRFHTPYHMDMCNDVEKFVDDALGFFGSDLERGTIAVDIWSPAMHDVLLRRLPRAQLVNGQDLMLSVRKIKTAEEIQCMKMAYVISEAGMQAALNILKPGVRECELVG